MKQHRKAPLEPRKTPVQARSVVSVDAILEATIQVLLELKKERLTTTRVASRAGVSVGTLYQYFPNKSALLQAVLKRHLTGVFDEVEAVCNAQEGKSLSQMATALITAFLEAKMRRVKASVALYSVSDDVGATKIAREMGSRSTRIIADMLATSHEQLTKEPRLVASMLYVSMAGVSRAILESSLPEKELEALRPELILLACSYLNNCSVQSKPKVVKTG